jgi:hypothetical protein
VFVAHTPIHPHSLAQRDSSNLFLQQSASQLDWLMQWLVICGAMVLDP